MKKHSRWFVTIAAIVVVVALLGSYKYLQIRSAMETASLRPERSETVEASEATKGEFVTDTTVLGEVVSPQSVELRSEIAGRVTAVNFAPGDLVKKGEVLIQLDVTEETARLQAAKARARLTKLDLDRFEKLYEQKTVSKQQVDKSRAEYDVTLADIQELEALIEKKTLRAPFDAVAGLHTLEAGEYIKDDEFIVELVGTLDYTWVDFNLPMGQTFVDVGSEVAITLPENDAPNLSGTIIARDQQASASSRNLRYRARVDMEKAIPANTVVRVTVPLKRVTRVLVPTTTLLKDSMGDYVYILTPDPSGKGYRATRRGVTIGERDAETVAILSGLSEGELIADNGSFKLREGLLTLITEKYVPPETKTAAEITEP